MTNHPNQSINQPVWPMIVIIILVVIFFAVWLLPNILQRRSIASHFQITAFEHALSQYYADIGHYPSTSEGLKVLVERPAGPVVARWNGPYVKKNTKFIDGWGRKLQYECPGTHHPDTYDLWSYGADGKKGGKGNNKDIGHWYMGKE